MFGKDKHMGHILFESLRSRPDSICQIDASTGERETNASVLARSVQLARCLRRLGLVPGDVLMLSGKNHNDLQIPYNAALFNGLPITGIDPSYKLVEVKEIFCVTEPKIAFCEPESYVDYVQASTDLRLATQVFTFGTGERSMQQLLDSNKDDTPVEEFEKDEPHQPVLHLSTIQWISGLFNLVGLHQTKIQTSAPATPEHIIDIINEYKPVSVTLNPSLATSLLRCDKPCDMTSFSTVIISGGKVYQDLLLDFKERLDKKAAVMEAYGQTENLGPVVLPNPLGPVGSCGKPFVGLQIKLVDPENGKDISGPNITGELWTKGVCFSGYYKNSEDTAKAFTEDGWFKTGDLLYRDKDDNYYFVERLKMLIKYRNYQIVPPEIEAVIRSHEAVADVSVTSVPHEEDGEHAVACVVTRRGAAVTSREIKELVASKLSDAKQLRGGVVFLEQLPMTHAGKVARGKLRQLVISMHRE